MPDYQRIYFLLLIISTTGCLSACINMDDVFLLPVDFKGEKLELETRLQPWGYTYRFEVQINGLPVQFEPDEERNYRALIEPEQVEDKGSKLNVALLQAIAGSLSKLHS